VTATTTAKSLELTLTTITAAPITVANAAEIVATVNAITIARTTTTDTLSARNSRVSQNYTGQPLFILFINIFLCIKQKACYLYLDNKFSFY
jgi:hypothetical protein